MSLAVRSKTRAHSPSGVNNHVTTHHDSARTNIMFQPMKSTVALGAIHTSSAHDPGEPIGSIERIDTEYGFPTFFGYHAFDVRTIPFGNN